MKRIDGRNVRQPCEIMHDALVILPAVALGVTAMIHGGVSMALWAQQAAAWLAFALLALLLRRVADKIPAPAWSAAFLAFLAAALLGQEVGGARRWVDLVVFHAHAAELVLPAMIVLLCRMNNPYPVLIGAAAVLRFQPDLSQLTAFCAAALVVLWRHREKRLFTAGSLLLLGVFVIRCLRTPVVIEPVSYCEGILGMLAGVSGLLGVAGYLSLAMIPAFFAYHFCKRKNAQMLGLAAYYAVCLLFALSGEYPVPFMGFGLSPIAGYCFACSFSD